MTELSNNNFFERGQIADAGSKQQLVWEDTREIEFDSSCYFGKGTCFDGWESLREEAETPIGRFAVWKEMGIMNREIWSAWGGNLGYMAWHSFKNEDEAKQWVLNLVYGN